MDMVQRTGLVIILLLTFVVSILSGQQSGFMPPELLSEPVLELPADWKEVYSPAETTILIEIKADSTATLIKVLDGKTELKPLIENLLPTLVYIPAFVDENAIDANLTLKLNLVRKTQVRPQVLKTVSDSLKLVDKTTLYRWINRQRQAENLQEILSSDTKADNIFAPQTTDTFYRTNFYMMGLNSRPYLIIKDGFIQPPRMYYNAATYQMLSNFRRISANGNLISFANEKYNLPAMCTDVYAGLGDYEYNFARVQVVKNHLLGIEDFYTEIGFLGQNGWWQETISDQTSSRLFLSLPVKQTTISFNIEKYDQDIPSTVLLPGIQNGNLFTIGHKLQELYLKWSLPWFTVGWQTGKEKLHANGLLNPQEYETGQFLLHKSFNLLATDFDMSYLYNYKNTLPKVQALYQFNKKSEHQGLINIRHRHNGFVNEDQLLVSEDGLEKADILVKYLFNPKSSVGLQYVYYDGMHITSKPENLYVEYTIPYFHSAYINQSLAADWEFNLDRSFSLNLISGAKKPDDSYEYLVKNEDFNFISVYPFAEAHLKSERQIGKINVGLEQTLQWNNYKKGRIELPEITGQTKFKLVKDMNYDNALSVGLNLTGHSDYMQSDNLSTPIYGSMIADAWFGVKITDLFEFQLMMKNIGDNIIFGLYPHPRTIIGTIHWFYLN